MNNRYIELEQFKELTEERHKDIIEWWKDNIQIGDLINVDGERNYLEEPYIDVVVYTDDKGICGSDSYEFSDKDIDITPLLNESQCREYIECKTKYTIQIEPYTNILGNSGTDISLIKNGIMKYCYEYHGKSLLQGYWEIIKQL